MNEKVFRFLFDKIVSQLYKEKVIVLYGARRVGKTTICKEILESERNKGKKVRYLSAELISVSRPLSVADDIKLKDFIGDVYWSLMKLSIFKMWGIF